jgi:hypothetical protein
MRKQPLFVLYDKEEEYTFLMADFMRNYPGVPWKIHAYTREKDLLAKEADKEIKILAVSERSYTPEIKSLKAERVLILGESGYKFEEPMETIDKYQSAEAVVQMFFQVYLEIAGEQPGRITDGNKTKFIGVYSPIKRCLQTTLALTMSEILAEKKRTLYLSFENYSSFVETEGKIGDLDLSDLVYFMSVDNEKFRLRLQSSLKQLNELVYVPPMRYGQNLLGISEEEWLMLLRKISESGLFDYVIMDLTDCIQGLPEILRICSRVYTVAKEDSIAKVKMMQYENMLSQRKYNDVLEKTERFVFPKFHYIPVTPDEYNHGEMADFVRNKMQLGGAF